MHVYICIYMYMCKYINISICIYMYIYICINIYILEEMVKLENREVEKV